MWIRYSGNIVNDGGNSTGASWADYNKCLLKANKGPREAKLSKKVKFDATDSFIGQKVTINRVTLTGDTSTQFMGELYEISMYRRIEPTLNTRTLNPGYHDILFYYRFGDE